jgi:hypothetical protein
MGTSPQDLHTISDLPTSHLRIWMAGQHPDSWYHQLAKTELVRRENRTASIKRGCFAALAALALFLSLYRIRLIRDTLEAFASARQRRS